MGELDADAGQREPQPTGLIPSTGPEGRLLLLRRRKLAAVGRTTALCRRQSPVEIESQCRRFLSARTLAPSAQDKRTRRRVFFLSPISVLKRAKLLFHGVHQFGAHGIHANVARF
jgi:hypothetical protein